MFNIHLSNYAESEVYKSFRSNVALQRIITGKYKERCWKYYDCGPKSKDIVPLVILSCIVGTAESFYNQVLSLSSKGFRIISVQCPPFSNHEKWNNGFDDFLKALKLEHVHLMGVGLGGYLAQSFTQFRSVRVKSLILCNSFCDIDYFVEKAPCLPFISAVPEFLLKKILLSKFPKGEMEYEIANSVDFMVEQLETLKHSELVSRIKLNCTKSNLVPEDLPLPKSAITIIDVMDVTYIPEEYKSRLIKVYEGCKVAYLKDGGNFPFLSRADEFNIHVELHLRANGFGHPELKEEIDLPLKINEE